MIEQTEPQRQELLREMDRRIDQITELVSRNPDRYLPPYSGQKPREFPTPDRTTSPERQDPDLPPKEKQPPPVRDVPEAEREKDVYDRAMVFNSLEWRTAQAAEMAREKVSPEAARAQILGLLGQAEPPSAAVERKPSHAPERTGQDRDVPEQGRARSR